MIQTIVVNPVILKLVMSIQWLLIHGVSIPLKIL
jgi:hypothetical protein